MVTQIYVLYGVTRKHKDIKANKFLNKIIKSLYVQIVVVVCVIGVEGKHVTKWPWEIETVAVDNLFPTQISNIPLSDYIDFMDSHVRVRAFKNGEQIGTFSVITDGTELGAEVTLQNGASFVIRVIGHPVTTDPIVTPEELANYLLTK